MKKLPACLVCAGALLTAMPASAQFAKPEDAIKYRQSAMYVMGFNANRLGAMVNNKAPFDAKIAAESAANIEYLSKLPWIGYVEGTGSDKGKRTKAKPVIWQQPDKFRSASQKMQEEAIKLNAVARSGDLEQIKSSFGALGRSCKACHDDFREE